MKAAESHGGEMWWVNGETREKRVYGCWARRGEVPVDSLSLVQSRTNAYSLQGPISNSVREGLVGFLSDCHLRR